MVTSTFRKLVGNIRVYEEKNNVYIEGLPTYRYLNDIVKIWRTSKIGLHMFSRITSSSVVFHKFFLLEVIYTLETVLQSEQRKALNERVIRRTLEQLKENTWYKRTQEKFPDILDFRQLSKLKVTLFDTQRNFLEIYNERVPKFNLRGYMLAADPGTGKTINSIALAVCAKVDCTIVLCQKNSIDRVWGATIGSIFKDPVDYWTSSSEEELVHGKQYYVFHYEQLQRAMTFFRNHKYKKVMVILDESHNMNDLDSLRTQLYVQLVKLVKAEHVLPMSGTPIKAIGKEAVPLLSTIDPFFDQEAERRFIDIFGKSSSKGLDILANRLGYVVHRVEKALLVTHEVVREDVLVQVPNGQQYTLVSVSLEMSEFIKQRMQYYQTNYKKYERHYLDGLAEHEDYITKDPKALEEYAMYTKYIAMIKEHYDPETMKEESKYCNWYEDKKIIPHLKQPLKDQFRNSKSVVKYYDLKVQGEALGRILGKRRMECNVAIAENTDFEIIIDTARKKTVIFTSYIEVVDKIYDILSKTGYKPLRVYGSTNHDLANIVKKFEKDEDANPLIATFQSLSTAVPLIMASDEILMNRPFRSGELDQAEARVDRVDQDGPVRISSVILDTHGEPNLSTRTDDILAWSRNQVAQIMGEAVPEEIVLEAYVELKHLNVLSEEEYNRIAMESIPEPKRTSDVRQRIYDEW